MISLDTQKAKVQQLMTDPAMVEAALPAYMDLRGIATKAELKEKLANNEIEMEMLRKFITAAAVSLVAGKAAQINKGV